MAKKKSKRSRSSAASRRKQRSPATPRTEGAPVVPKAKVTSQKRTTPRQTDYAKGKTDFAEEYRYVFQDLRRLAVLAASIFIILIALSFVLR